MKKTFLDFQCLHIQRRNKPRENYYNFHLAIDVLVLSCNPSPALDNRNRCRVFSPSYQQQRKKNKTKNNKTIKLPTNLYQQSDYEFKYCFQDILLKFFLHVHRLLLILIHIYDMFWLSDILCWGVQQSIYGSCSQAH